MKVQQVEAPAMKPDNLSVVPGPGAVQLVQVALSDLHPLAVASAAIHSHGPRSVSTIFLCCAILLEFSQT